MLLVSTTLLIKFACIKVKAESTDTYVEITAYATLYKDSNKNLPLITLPKTYYARLIDPQTDISKSEMIAIKYGTISGFMESKYAKKVTQIPASLTESWSPTGETKDTYGTYLRLTPTITSENVIELIEPNTAVKILGSIEGERPTDGASHIWYYLDVELGPTKLIRGYVYSERVTLNSEFKEQFPPSEPVTTTPEGIADVNTNLNNNINAENALNSISFTGGIKWFLIILFSVIAIIIFGLLMIPTNKLTDKKMKKRTCNQEYFATTNANSATLQEFNKNSITTKNIQKTDKNHTKTIDFYPKNNQKHTKSIKNHDKKMIKIKQFPSSNNPFTTQNIDRNDSLSPFLDIVSPQNKTLFTQNMEKKDPRSTLPKGILKYFKEIKETSSQEDDLL